MLYLVTYDLNKPKQDYEKLFSALKHTETWWHHLDSTWLVKSSETIEDFANRIKKEIDQNDSLLIVEITKDSYKGWLTQKAWDWLKNNISG
jgi:CRISPR/Cas system-associated endoribonuclease Cas2